MARKIDSKEMRMKTILRRARSGMVGMVLGLLAGTLQGEETREFHSATGQSLRGELVSVVGDKVSIKGADGRLITGVATFFSPEDQAFFKEWSATHKPVIAYQFKAGFAPKRMAADRAEESGGAVKVTYEKWTYQVTLESAASTPLENVEVRYRVFKAAANVDAENRSGPKVTRVGKYSYIEGSEKIPSMTLRKSQTFVTAEMPITKS
ncbi:MAG: hypothetical protein ABL994_12885, partial [Verrucomicrobiales bacterium]